jgi:hypothetical protein
VPEAPGRPRPVTGYTVVLPPGWCRVPVRQGSAKAIRAAVDEAIRSVPGNVPRDRVAPYRVELEGRLRAMVATARSRGGIDMYLPAAPMHGLPVAASFIVAEGTVGAPGPDHDPVHLVTYLATEEAGSAPVTVDGAPAVRREHTALPEQAAEVDAGTRRVDYIIPMPGGQGRWLIAAFSTMGGGDPGDELSGVLVQLFDAIMSTFRWSYA